MRWRAVGVGLVVLAAGGLALATGCGRYGPPIRTLSTPPPAQAPAQAEPAPAPADGQKGQKDTLGEPEQPPGSETAP